jgi:hypothetical protein
VEDLACGRHHRQVGDAPEAFTLSIEQIGLQECGKPFQRHEISLSRWALDEHLLLTEPAPLIQTPDGATGAQRRRTTDPTEQTMHGRMHPGHDAGTMVEPLIATHAMAQQIAQKDLIRTGQGLSCGSERASPDT